MARIPDTDLDVFPLCLGGNVFGWTADREASFAVLDAYAAAGGNFIDTADVYSAFAPPNVGGESETLIGEWMASRGNRSEMIVATKVGMLKGRTGLAPDNVRAALDDSLGRLQTDYVDLYYAHQDDQDTPLEDALATFGELRREGKLRYPAASNYTAPRLTEALDIAGREGLPRYVALQTHYSLMERALYENELAEVCAREGIVCLPYWSLARGFLTGKYRDGQDVDSPRAGIAGGYLDDRGRAVLEVLDELAAAHDTTDAAVALAWLRVQPTVIAPVASARNAEQLAGILPFVELELSEDELARLSNAAGV
jgi:aryl-alcohol dehydrogenase-like predicted oxidoreductase